jgi:dTDP-4-dehydrorhamnose 3,5-epimerase
VKFVETEIPGVILVEPDVHGDTRGFFLETYHQPRYEAGGVAGNFVQDNHSRSSGGILRGLHMQIEHLQGKLVRVIEGEVYDVAVDVRRGSPHFGNYVAALLSAENFKQLYIPPGFAHGFYVTSAAAQFVYKCTDVYHPEKELTIAWNDPDLEIPWPTETPSLSEKDANGSRLADLMELLPEYPAS